MQFIKEYLEKYPNEFLNVMALVRSLGRDEVNEICKKALDEYKMIKINTDYDEPDRLTYELVA
jgi:hypothetical protein